MQLTGGMKGFWHLPCAGITQIRFDGFDLSLIRPMAESNTPGNAEVLSKIKEDLFYQTCNLPATFFVLF
jgi:hypothetical protein